MDKEILTPTQITRYLKYKVDNDTNLQSICLRGEISNFKAHTRGHFYFTLKDETARISAIMFASSAKNVKFLPTDGMKVLITGKISVYEQSGSLQIYVNSMEEDGIGNLYLEFEKLKKKLSEEGLFDESHKKKIPRYPNTIGIITASTGAAIRDILTTIKRRYPLVKTILFPSLVQGEYAAEDIVKNINLSKNYDLDLLIVGRGGGSIEDMWCFNEEIVARAIYDLEVPVISAVGHEIDFTIADFVADLRAPTPTAAAELAVPDYKEVLAYIDTLKKRSFININHKIKNLQDILSKIKKSRILLNPRNLYLDKEEKFSNIIDRLNISIKHMLEINNNKLSKLKSSFIFKNPMFLIDNKKSLYKELKNNLIINYKNYINKLANKYLLSVSKLDTLSPLKTLTRGYSITRYNNLILTDSKKIKVNEIINIELDKSLIDAKVIEVKEK